MQLRFFLSCLLGSWLFFGSSAPASIEPNDWYKPRGEPAELKADDTWRLPNADPSKQSSSDSEAVDEAKETKRSSLERARAALAESTAPILSHREICERLVEVAQANELPIGFFANLIWRESNFDNVAISRVGAMGIAQFMPDVAEKLGLDAFDARDALPASGRLLRTLRARFGNLGLMAAAYNAGPKRVSDWLEQRSALPKETREYVAIITGHPVEHWRAAKPQTVVFNVPRRVPCHRSATFAEVEQAERTAQIAKSIEEKKLAELTRELERSRAKGKARGTFAASSKGSNSCKVPVSGRKLCSERTAGKAGRSHIVLVRS